MHMAAKDQTTPQNWVYLNFIISVLPYTGPLRLHISAELQYGRLWMGYTTSPRSKAGYNAVERRPINNIMRKPPTHVNLHLETSNFKSQPPAVQGYWNEGGANDEKQETQMATHKSHQTQILESRKKKE